MSSSVFFEKARGKQMTIRALLIATLVIAPTCSLADVLRCKIADYKDDVFVTTSPDTNSSDKTFARIGVSPGVGDRAIVVPDRMGATAFVELNADDTPVGLLTVGKDMRVVKSRHAIDPMGRVFAPSQSTGACTRCASLKSCPP
jgi:hypothetical protein